MSRRRAPGGRPHGTGPAIRANAHGEVLPAATLRVRRRLLGAKETVLTDPAGQVPWTLGSRGLRLIGSGGLFCWCGSFCKPGHGRYRAYLTDRSRIVACPTDAGLVLVSPTDPDTFVRATAGARS